MIRITAQVGDDTQHISREVLVAAVVVNYGSHELLEANLLGLTGVDIVVVDNYHSAQERLAVTRSSEHHGWSLVAIDTNSGFGSAVNAGIAFAAAKGAEVVVLINPDASISKAVIDELVGECVRDPMVMVSPRIVRSDGTTWFQGGRILFDQGRTAMADLTATACEDGWLTGACLVVPVAFWNLVGGFDDDYFMYWEDVDLSHRWRNSGGRLLVRGDLIAVHLVGGTQSVSAHGKSALYYRYNCRNRLIFAAKYLAAGDLRRWMKNTLPYARSVVLRGGRRQFLRRPVVPIWSALRGSIEGYLVARRRLRELERL